MYNNTSFVPVHRWSQTLHSQSFSCAGLCRTSEIFGVSEFVIGNLSYLNDRTFQSLSVTAEKWIPITEVQLPVSARYWALKPNYLSIPLRRHPIGRFHFDNARLDDACWMNNEEEEEDDACLDDACTDDACLDDARTDNACLDDTHIEDACLDDACIDDAHIDILLDV